MKTYYSNSPKSIQRFTTEELRDNFLIQSLFVTDQISLNYSHDDRIIVGGIVPATKPLTLEAGKELGADFFFERREGGVVNIGGGEATALVDGTSYSLKPQDCLYIGKGAKDVSFTSTDSSNPAKLYFNSTPAHKEYPNKLIDLAAANKVHLGSEEECNKRTINQYIVPGICDSCQLTLGMTILEPGSIWNTMPCHTHERRMEIYLYFDMSQDTRVFHMMGEPAQTRHLIVANEEAIISPSWSIHSGVGTGRYTFIWSMCGENQTFTDMDMCAMADLR